MVLVESTQAFSANKATAKLEFLKIIETELLKVARQRLKAPRQSEPSLDALLELGVADAVCAGGLTTGVLSACE